VRELTLIPSGGGAFEVIANGRLIYSKKKTHRHPTIKEIREALQSL
jgi:selT/selW/selH-like putative selenoprotein